MEYELTKKQIDSLKVNIKEFHTGSRDELIEKIRSYDEILEGKVEEMAQVWKYNRQK